MNVSLQKTGVCIRYDKFSKWSNSTSFQDLYEPCLRQWVMSRSCFSERGGPQCRPKCSIRISSANFLIVFHSIYGYVLLSFQDVAMEQTTDRWPTCTNIRNQCKSGTNQHQHHLQNYSDVGLFTFSFPAHRMESIPRCCALHGHSHRATREPLHACLMHHTSLCCCHCSHHLWLESSPCQLQLCAALYLLQRPGFNHRSC